MKKWHLVILTVLLLSASPVFAFEPNHSPVFPASGCHNPESFSGPMGPGGGFRDFGPVFHAGFTRHLNLSKEQLDRINALMNRSHKETRDLKYDLAQKRIEMRKLFTDPKIDDATLLAKQKELSSLHRKLLDNMARTMIESRKILTPEQLAGLDQMPPPRAGIMDKHSD